MHKKAPEYHVPILGSYVSKYLITDPNGIYVDATLGGGGHAEMMLKRLGPNGKLIGIDRDPQSHRSRGKTPDAIQRSRLYCAGTVLESPTHFGRTGLHRDQWHFI